jgi:hypothetical protein
MRAGQDADADFADEEGRRHRSVIMPSLQAVKTASCA